MEEYFRRVDEAYGRFTGAELERELQTVCAEAAARFGAESREAASLLSELGAFYRGQRALEQSETQFRRAKEIYETHGWTQGGDYATLVNNLAGTHRLQRRWDEAEREFAQCMELYRGSVGTRHVLYASALNNLSLVKLDRGDREAARALLREASEILAGLPEQRDEYATSLVNLGVLSLRCGQAREAEASLAEAAALYETELGTDTPHYHAALHALACALEAQQETEKARAAAEKALDAALALYGPEHPEVRALREHLARLRGEDRT